MSITSPTVWILVKSMSPAFEMSTLSASSKRTTNATSRIESRPRSLRRDMSRWIAFRLRPEEGISDLTSDSTDRSTSTSVLTIELLLIVWGSNESDEQATALERLGTSVVPLDGIVGPRSRQDFEGRKNGCKSGRG